MFKDFLYFSKGQKIGLIVLTIIIVLLIAVNLTVPYFIKRPAVENNKEFIAQYEKFKNSLKDKPQHYQKYSPFDEKNKNYDNFPKSATVKPFAFDPNTLDSVGFVKLGLKPFAAKNIINYRKKGGKFKTADDFSKIYGILPEQYEKLKPFIDIPSEFLTQNINKKEAKNTENIEQKYSVKSDTVHIELNAADTADLQKLRGIGSGWAKAIVAYRQKLGGYVSVNQLLEIKNFPSETFFKIEKNLSVDVSKVQKIEINRANVEFMRKHPYLDLYKAKAVYDLRLNKKTLKNIDELNILSEFSTEELQKIAPYFDFKEINRLPKK